MSVMTIAEFTANCPEVLENVEATGEPVFITRDGVPIASLYSFSASLKSIVRGDEGAVH